MGYDHDHNHGRGGGGGDPEPGTYINIFILNIVPYSLPKINLYILYNIIFFIDILFFYLEGKVQLFLPGNIDLKKSMAKGCKRNQ